jgi:hypothetical protein
VARRLNLSIDMAAITIGNDVYFDGGYDPYSINGISRIAHELAHARQWQRGGAGFLENYFGSYFRNRRRGMSRDDAYRNIPHELGANRLEDIVRQGLRTGGNPCETAICRVR